MEMNWRRISDKVLPYAASSEMDTQIPNIDETGGNVLNSIDSVNGQEIPADVDIENIKFEIVSIAR